MTGKRQPLRYVEAGAPPEDETMAEVGIVLVHGFWGRAAHWAKVVPRLRRLGFGSLHAVENPLTPLTACGRERLGVTPPLDPSLEPPRRSAQGG